MSCFRKRWSCVVVYLGFLCANRVFGQSDLPIRNEKTEKSTSRSKAISSERNSQHTKPSNQKAIDGTWREDGRYIIINLNGQELRLLKSQPVQQGSGNAERRERDSFVKQVVKQVVKQQKTSGAVVEGKLLVGRNPLESCRVTLIPLRRSWDSYVVNESAEKFSTTTNFSGRYRFENVVPGRYKLFWKPQGTRQWIRRLRFRPDVIVRDKKHLNVKTIRSALRTIN